MDKFIRKDGLFESIQSVCPQQTSYVLCLVCFYVLNQLGLCHVEDWYEHSIASWLYPDLDVSSQRISDFLKVIGTRSSLDRFFSHYSGYLNHIPGDIRKVIIDSTGLPNSIHFPLTAVNSHNGTISNEVRMELVVEQDTGVPVYMRYMCGSIPDIATIQATLLEMEELKMDITDLLIDAGYYSQPNFEALSNAGIDFVCRLKENLNLYKDLFSKHRSELIQDDNTFKYGNRAVFIREVPQNIQYKDKNGKDCTRDVWAYICLDIGRASLENLKMLENMGKNNLSEVEICEGYETHGSFALLSTKKLQREEVLPLYYVRQEVEQTFDIVKNDTNSEPVRIQSEAALGGHLFLTFIASVIVKRIQYILEFEQPKRNKKFNPITLLQNLGYQHCHVFDNQIVVQEADSKANQGYKVFGIESPLSINRKID